MLLLACCLAAVTILRAQEPAPAPAPAPGSEKTTESTEGTEAKEGGSKAAGNEARPKDAPDVDPARKPGVVGPTPGRFEPTEKVRADFDVSFPVDI